MDVNWKYQEAMMVSRDRIQFTPEEEARIRLAGSELPGPRARKLRGRLASALVSLAARLDSESPYRAIDMRRRVASPPAPP